MLVYIEVQNQISNKKFGEMDSVAHCEPTILQIGWKTGEHLVVNPQFSKSATKLALDPSFLETFGES